MPKLEEWQHHIWLEQFTDGVAMRDQHYICGVKKGYMDWHFVSIDHAFQNAENGSRLQACPECVKKIISTFSE